MRSKTPILVVIVLLASGRLASAECVSLSGQMAVDQADVVFEGTIVQMRSLVKEYPVIDSSQAFTTYVIEFEVSEHWKGPVGPRFTLHLMPMDSDGMYERFEAGATYVVFGRRNGDVASQVRNIDYATYGSSSCSGTFPTPPRGELETYHSKALLNALGRGRPVR